MKVKLDVTLRPFSVPNFVVLESPPGARQEGSTIPLSALDPETLEQLCEDFISSVFKKAGKQRPPLILVGHEGGD